MSGSMTNYFQYTHVYNTCKDLHVKTTTQVVHYVNLSGLMT